LSPAEDFRLRREVSILRAMADAPHSVRLLDMVEDGGFDGSRTKALVLELAKNSIVYKRDYETFTDAEIKHFVYQILETLDFAHSRGIMHRDVKPGNVMIDRDAGTAKLIDWGLSDYYFPGKEFNLRVQTRHYKAPELLMGITDYDYAVDMWGVGCILGHMILKRGVLFQGSTNYDQLDKIARLLGTDQLWRAERVFGITVDDGVAIGVYPRVEWSTLVNATNADTATPVAIDLLNKLLTVDYRERLTASEAMHHPYFETRRHRTDRSSL